MKTPTAAAEHERSFLSLPVEIHLNQHGVCGAEGALGHDSHLLASREVGFS